MAVHAAMVEQMDWAIGRIVAQIEAMGALDNTLILFLSDNGASAEIMVRGDGHDQSAPVGSARTFVCLGPGWSTACNTPMRLHKTWMHEGGVATPLIAHWPRGIAVRGAWTHTVGHVVDIVPTVCALAGVSASQSGDRPAFMGESLAPALADPTQRGRSDAWFLHEGNRAYRSGDWKIAAVNFQAAWELFDLRRDRGETRDLAAQFPTIVEALGSRWEQIRLHNEALARP
jgi:arylsulfatase